MAFGAAMGTASFDGDETERPPCPLCGSDAPLQSPYHEGVFSVVCCGDCAAWYLSPRLREARMRELYEHDQYFAGGTEGYADYAEQEQSLRATFRALLRRLAERGGTGGALLEVGCGYGYFLDEADSYFSRRTGCEMSPQAAARARAFGAEVFSGSIDSIPPNQVFDCIVALHVIEHVYDPKAFVTHLRRHLTESGTLVLAAPDMGSMWRRILGKSWPSFKYPEHVVFYDRHSLSAVMRETGFPSPRRIPYPHAFPLNEICAKLRLPPLPGIGGLNVWLPGTTLAMIARADKAAGA
jgi:SAM-dependent methyltransferase